MSTITRKFTRYRNLSLGDNENMVVRLILINVVLFTGLFFVKVVYLITGDAGAVQRFYREVIPWVTLPADPAKLLSRPWTILSFMFIHVGFWQLLSNVIWFWWFGSILQSLAGPGKIFPLYLYGGLAGALFFLLSFNLVPGLAAYKTLADTAGIGASASVMALIAAATTLAPNYRIFPMLNGGIPLFVITIIYVALDIIGPHGGVSAGYFAAQAGAALTGYLLIVQLRHGRDLAGGLNQVLYRINHVFDPPEKKPRRVAVKDQLFYKKEIPPYRKIESISSKKVDEILDKINQTGYDSLSSEEKDILLRASRQEDN